HDTTPTIDKLTLNYYSVALSSRITELDPSEGNYFVSPKKIIGISSSDRSGTNALSHTEIRIKHLKDETYWSGTQWVSSSNTWVRAAGTETWELNVKNIAWILGDEYCTQSCAVTRRGIRETLKKGVNFIVIYTLYKSGFCNYPNPFDPNRETTCIEYILSRDSDVKIIIYDINHGRVKEWNFGKGSLDGKQGINRIYWNGKNTQGYTIANGVYFCYLYVNGQKEMTKILVLK
ncbi:MAG: T9SS type A sorting domain-containing protein, partial [bacterium]|nr:T9SS type A sorting domain-containing protein [bacterium]